MKIDQNTITLLKLLRDGRKSYREIAEVLGISENTVRTRVNTMKEEGILDIAGLIDPAAIPGHTLVFVAVKLQTPDLVIKGELFSKLKGVVSVGVVTGRYDLILTVLLNENFSLLEFFTQEMAKTFDCVQSNETFVVYKGFNLKVPYIL